MYSTKNQLNMAKKKTAKNQNYDHPPKEGRVPSLRIPKEVEQILRKAAMRDHRTFSGYCAMYLSNHAYEISSKREKIEY